MNAKTQKILSGILGIIILAGAFGYYLFKKNIGTLNIPSKAPIEEAGTVNGENKVASLPGFKVPDGFSLSIFAKNVPGARVLEMDSKGRILVSETSEGKIVALIDTDNNKVADKQVVLGSGLRKPHGILFRCEGDGCFLYVAESNQLSRFSYDAERLALGPKEKLMSINSSITDSHFTRSLLELPSPAGDNFVHTLLVSVGSSCNVCHEKDTDHASIISYDLDTGKKEVYAKGLRNATFMALNPVSGKVYATEMGRDNLGDNLPPDEINIIDKDKNYGWPICYGKNIHDTQFDPKGKNICSTYEPSFIDLQAHSAPLGIAFIPEDPPAGGWPEEYWYNALVAYHGSWNRSEPTGYKIARIKMNSKGEYQATEDFITGWLTESGLPAQAGKKTGRPVDIKVFPGGVAYISDDSSGVIYRLWKTK